MRRYGTQDDEGNFLGNVRCNFSIPRSSKEMLHELALENGVNHSVMLNLLIRAEYKKLRGSVIPIKYLGGRTAQ